MLISRKESTSLKDDAIKSEKMSGLVGWLSNKITRVTYPVGYTLFMVQFVKFYRRCLLLSRCW